MWLFFIWAFIVEALTEVLVKSEIFLPARKKLKYFSKWLGKFINCGYCTSFWVAAFLLFLKGDPFSISGVSPLDYFLSLFLLQRASNVMHNIIDKVTDKYYDTRYINTEKDE